MKTRKTVKVEYLASGSEALDFERFIDSLGPVEEEKLWTEDDIALEEEYAL